MLTSLNDKTGNLEATNSQQVPYIKQGNKFLHNSENQIWFYAMGNF